MGNNCWDASPDWPLKIGGYLMRQLWKSNLFDTVLMIRDILFQILDPTIPLSQICILDPKGKKPPDPGSDLILYKGY
jgi:hypothetical protein